MKQKALNLGNIGKLEDIILHNKVVWPDDASFGVCLTHDVDRVKKTYQYLTHSIKKCSLKPMSGLFRKGSEPYWQFENIMQIEKEHGVRSTFFFLKESFRLNPFKPSTWPMSLGRYNLESEKLKRIIQKLDRNGWEIGLHGSIRSYCDEGMLSHEKKALESIVGHDINGIRQHWLNLEIPNTWERQRNIGLIYDTSFSYKNDIGFKEGIHHLFSPAKLNDFVVFPLSIMDTFLFGKHSNYKDAWSEVHKIIDFVEKNHGVLCILWHQMVFYEKDFPVHVAVYKRLIEECQSRGAWFGTCRQAYDLIIKYT